MKHLPPVYDSSLKPVRYFPLYLLLVLLLTGCSTFFGKLDGKALDLTVGAGNQTETSTLNSGGAATGLVDGVICYPGEQGNGTHLYFIDAGTGVKISQFLLPGELSYTIALPPGSYQAFAWPDSANPATRILGSYTQAVLCGLGANCADHTPVTIYIQDGQQISGVYVCDWSLPADAAPAQVVNPPSSQHTEARFSSEVVFATTPNRNSTQRVFPAGTQEIYAMWDYQNMENGQVIRRVWLRDGSVWIDREESWDIEHYGSNGTVYDVSIYDKENGLLPGKYTLQLYINGVAQLMEGAGSTFEIAPPLDNLAVNSPDGSLTARVIPPGELVVTTDEGNTRSLFTSEEVVSITWFPDSRHILFSTRNRANQIPNAGTLGILDTMWIADTATDEVWSFADESYNLHEPRISQSGRFVAALGGSSWFDACFVDRTLWFFEVDGYKPISQMPLTDFTGLPNPEQAYVEKLLGWDGETRFDAFLAWTCTDQAAEHGGAYRFDLVGRTASRVQTGNWSYYTNDFYRISLFYPAHWEVEPGQPESTPSLRGSDGFLSITGMGGPSLDTVTTQQAEHKLLPYGPNPVIEALEIKGYPARIIRPNNNNPEAMVSVIIEIPYLTEIDERINLLMLSGDAAHIQEFINSIAFNPP